MITVKVDPAQASRIDALLSQFSLEPGQETGDLARGFAKALNRAAVAAKVVMVRAIAQDLGARQADIKKYVWVTEAKAASDKLVSRVTPKAKSGIPLIELQATGPQPSRGKGSGVRAKAPPGRFPHAFIATTRNGHTGVYQRIGGKRLPITELRTRPLPEMFRQHRAAGNARALESLKTNLVSELRYLLSRR